MRRVTAETLYDLETECRRQGWGADPALVYDSAQDARGFFVHCGYGTPVQAL